MKIKSISVIFIISIFFLSSYSINGMTKKQNTVSPDSAVSETQSKIDAKDKKDTEKKGKIEVSKDDVYYVINWTSKSKKSLKVTGSLKDEIKGLKGKIIEAEGNIEYKSKWSGTIDITSYKVVK